MPENKALKVLPPELPKEYREFVACTRDTLEVEPGPLKWAKIPGVPDSLKPTATFEGGEAGSVKVTISAVGLSLEVDVSVTKHGNLKADTSSWPFDTPFVGDQLKELAKGVDGWVDEFNAELRRNHKKLGPVRVVNGRLTGAKVALDAKVAMSNAAVPWGDRGPNLPEPQVTSPGVEVASRGYATAGEGADEVIVAASEPYPIEAPGSVAEGAQAAFRGRDQLEDLGSRVPARRADRGRTGAVTLLGAGAGLVIATVSTGVLLFGAAAPSSPGAVALPPVGKPITVTGTLATSDLDLEVVRDVSSGMTLRFPDNGGLVDGAATVKYEARSSSGGTFVNTSQLDLLAVLDATSGVIVGTARHHATAEAGSQTQTRELSPLFVHLDLPSGATAISGGFQGVGFSYPATGTADGTLVTAPGNMSIGGSLVASALDRPDTDETVLENAWRFFLNEGGTIAGSGVVRVQQAFVGDAFGAGCTFEAIRAATVNGTFQPAGGAVTGTAQIVAWGNKSEACTFQTGVLAEDVAVTGHLDAASGQLTMDLAASATMSGPFSIDTSFDPAIFREPGQGGKRDTRLPALGVLSGASLTGLMIGLHWFGRRRDRSAPG